MPTQITSIFILRFHLIYLVNCPQGFFMPIHYYFFMPYLLSSLYSSLLCTKHKSQCILLIDYIFVLKSTNEDKLVQPKQIGWEWVWQQNYLGPWSSLFQTYPVNLYRLKRRDVKTTALSLQHRVATLRIKIYAITSAKLKPSH